VSERRSNLPKDAQPRKEGELRAITDEDRWFDED
jgi:hypothetical protein